jgi:hypothetical protein
MLGRRWKAWNTSDTRPRRSRARPSSPSRDSSLPSSRTLPWLGRSSPAAMAISVDLPEPDGPTTATRSPGSMAKSTPRRISTGPAADGRVSQTPSRVSGAPGLEASYIVFSPGSSGAARRMGRSSPT